MKLEKLKELDISLHVIATGAGAGLQSELWAIPGSSAYLSGASFPYSAEEHEEIIGFKPEHYCSEEDAIDLASAAYMMAYRFGGKKPVGLGITASVASESTHRGGHRIFGCIMTDDKVILYSETITKGKGHLQRWADGHMADDAGKALLNEIFNIDFTTPGLYKDGTKLARDRFFNRSYFMADGRRLNSFVVGTFDPNRYALMSGAFNPPHKGHYGASAQANNQYNLRTIFEVTANPPHKGALSVQEMLKRAKLLRGQDRLFSVGLPLYLDKARAYPGMTLIMGADALVRMLDPKWGVDIENMLAEFDSLGTDFLVSGRVINGNFITSHDIVSGLPKELKQWYGEMFKSLDGRWDVSSTELRDKI